MKSFKICLLALTIVAICIPAALAEAEKPTLAILSFGRSPAFALTDSAILDTLQAYALIDAEERASLGAGNDLAGEHVTVLYRDAGFDMATANLMVENALDEGVDVLLTVSSQVGYVAGNMLREMEAPPALIFAIVSAPYETGLAQSPCIKPDYVTGTAMVFNFQGFQPLALIQNPSLEKVGILMDPSDPASEYLAGALNGTLESMNLSGEYAAYNSIAELGVATQSLVDKGVDIVLMLPNMTASGGIPAIQKAAYGIPTVSMLVSDVHAGITMAEGFDGWYREGAIAATMAVAALKGELDIARTGINMTASFRSALNLDSARENGVEFVEAAIAQADYVIEDGEVVGSAIELPGVGADMQQVPLEERMEGDAQLLASLACTDEKIAEQQAALDAMDG